MQSENQIVLIVFINLNEFMNILHNEESHKYLGKQVTVSPSSRRPIDNLKIKDATTDWIENRSTPARLSLRRFALMEHNSVWGVVEHVRICCRVLHSRVNFLMLFHTILHVVVVYFLSKF